jgi:hypothetical protein
MYPSRMTLLATEEPPLRRRRIISSAVFIRKQRLYLSASIHFPLNPLSLSPARIIAAPERAEKASLRRILLLAR